MGKTTEYVVTASFVMELDTDPDDLRGDILRRAREEAEKKLDKQFNDSASVKEIELNEEA